MQAATVYQNLATQELVATTYCISSSLNATDVILDFCSLKPSISSPGNLISLWKEVVLVVSQNKNMLWVTDINTQKVIAQFQSNFPCLATAHYVISGFVDAHFFTNTPLVRCHGCAEGTSHTLITGFLTRKDVLLVEFSGKTNSFKPLINIPIEKGVDETLEPFLSITAQHVAVLCSCSPVSDTLTSASPLQSNSYSVIYLHYLGEMVDAPARILIPGTVLSVVLEESNGTDILIVQFRTDNECEIAEYAAQPLSNLWTPVKSERSMHYFVERLGANVYRYSMGGTGDDVVQYKQPSLPCTSLVCLSKNCALAYRNGVIVGVDEQSLCIFVGSAFVRQEITRAARVADAEHLKFLHCTLTETFQLILCAETASGSRLLTLRRPKGKHHYHVAVPGKRFRPLPNPKDAIWVPIECKILCVELTHAYCLILSRDTCTTLVTQDNSDTEIHLTVDSNSITLPFAIWGGETYPKVCSALQAKITAIYQYLCGLHSHPSSNTQQKKLIIGDETAAEVQKLTTPPPSSEIITPVRTVIIAQSSNASTENSSGKHTSIIANANMYSCTTSQTPLASNMTTDKAKLASCQPIASWIMILVLVSVSLAILMQIRKLINYSLDG